MSQYLALINMREEGISALEQERNMREICHSIWHLLIMEDLFSEAAIARVARIQTVAEESDEEPEKAMTGVENEQETIENDSSGEKDKDHRTAEQNELDKTTVTSKAAPKAHKFKRKHQEDDSSHTIFVGNVPATIKKKKLKQFFKYASLQPI